MRCSRLLTSESYLPLAWMFFGRNPTSESRFANLDNVILSSHVRRCFAGDRNAMGFRALDNIAAVLGGKGPIDPLWS